MQSSKEMFLRVCGVRYTCSFRLVRKLLGSVTGFLGCFFLLVPVCLHELAQSCDCLVGTNMSMCYPFKLLIEHTTIAIIGHWNSIKY